MAWKHKASRQERGYGSAWYKLREQIMDRDLWLCQVCLSKGRPTDATAVDHIEPKAKGGTDEPENLQAICDDCHKRKTAVDKGHAIKQQIGLDGWPVN